ncbi:hypothetical protein [Streptomyces sp. NPDC006551]|uniref:hypothetical protein n=1 Tax=Streptomyces sp. NPDC006551 TaxID=3157178 RepID=UPI0033A43EC1
MAITNIVVPYTVARDLVSYEEASRFFAETGHSVSVTTVRRWVEEEDLPVERDGKKDLVSFSDLLMAHADWVAGRSG